MRLEWTPLLRPVFPTLVRPLGLPRALIELCAERFRLLVAPHRGAAGTPTERTVDLGFDGRIAERGLLDDRDWCDGLRAVAVLVGEARRLGGDPIVVAVRPSFEQAVNADGFLQAIRALHRVEIRHFDADEPLLLESFERV